MFWGDFRLVPVAQLALRIARAFPTDLASGGKGATDRPFTANEASNIASPTLRHGPSDHSPPSKGGTQRLVPERFQLHARASQGPRAAASVPVTRPIARSAAKVTLG